MKLVGHIFRQYSPLYHVIASVRWRRSSLFLLNTTSLGLAKGNHIDRQCKVETFKFVSVEYYFPGTGKELYKM